MGSNDKNTQRVISYLGLRKTIGVIGILLPFVLAIGLYLIHGEGIKSSISSYYHTPMRDVFVGALCAIAIFMFAYRYKTPDNILGNIACLGALGVAFFPTKHSDLPCGQELLFWQIHVASAAILFIALAVFCLWLFRKSGNGKTSRKIKRNSVYTICGYGIILCILLIVLVSFEPVKSMAEPLKPVFWLEAFAIIFFGVSWLVKGEAILADVKKENQK